MNILLIQPALNPIPVPDGEGTKYLVHRTVDTPSRALLILGTIAEKQGHNIKIMHLDIDIKPLGDVILDFKPDILGITVNTFQVKSARNIVKLTRQVKPDTKIVIGGPHALVWRDEEQSWDIKDKADEVVIGEGEESWFAILGAPVADTIINYDLVDLKRFAGIDPIGAFPATAIMASRGCPNNCVFCNTPVFWGKKVRYRDPLSVVNEVELLHKKYGVREVFFQDDTFNLNHKWAFEIFEGLINSGLSKRMLFKIDCRVNESILTQEFLNLAYKAGVWNIFYGVESGSQYMLDRMKKNITVGEIKRAFDMTHKTKISTQASFIVGLPGETWATLAETAKLIKDIHPTRFGWCFFCPFPGTEATKEVTEKGHRKLVDYGDYHYGRVLTRTDELNYSDLESFGGFTR